MTTQAPQAIEDMLVEASKLPRRTQVAALCLRKKGKEKQVLMITSRGTGRWIIPKGWPMRGKTLPESALQEAWEEAGVKKAKAKKKPLGKYDYFKILDDGSAQPVRTKVYVVAVGRLEDEFPEAGQRKRKWMRPERAAELVAEPELQKILRTL